MSKVIQLSKSWRGFANTRRLMIFGDSYSSVEHMYSFQVPTAENPLGVAFPGDTWNEPGKPNWVGHLITKYCPEPRYTPPPTPPSSKGSTEGDTSAAGAAWKANPLLVHDYAKGGDTVGGMQYQVQYLFLGPKGISSKPESAPWTAEGTLFVTWVGINDCADSRLDYEEKFNTLFSMQDQLYDAGARNFLFIGVPPIQRIPGIPESMASDARLSYIEWNTHLEASARKFAEKHEDASIFLFSSYQVFDEFLDNLEAHGIPQSEERVWGGKVWVDNIHPRSVVHDYVAKNLANFLANIEPASAQ